MADDDKTEPKRKIPQKRTDEELDDMVMLYQMVKSSDKVFYLFKKLYPKTNIIRRKVFSVIQRYLETGHTKLISGWSEKIYLSAAAKEKIKKCQAKLKVMKEKRKNKSSKNEEPSDLSSKVVKFYERNPKKSYLKVARLFKTSTFTVKRILIEAGMVQHSEALRRPCPKRHKASNPPLKISTEECEVANPGSPDDDDDIGDIPLSHMKSLKHGQEAQNDTTNVQHSEALRRPCPKRHKASNPPLKISTEECEVANPGSPDDDDDIGDIPLSHMKSLKHGQEAQNDTTNVQHSEALRRPCPKGLKASSPPLKISTKECEVANPGSADNDDDDDDDDIGDIPLSHMKSLKHRQEAQDDTTTDPTNANTEEKTENDAVKENSNEEDIEKAEENENYCRKNAVVLTTRLDDMVVFRQDFNIKLHPSRFYRYVELESKPSEFDADNQNAPSDWTKPGIYKLDRKLRRINKLSSKRKTTFLEPYNMPTLRSKLNFCRLKRNLKLLKICDPICCQIIPLKPTETVNLMSYDLNMADKITDVADNLNNVADNFDTFEIIDSSSDDDTVPSNIQTQEPSRVICETTESVATIPDSAENNPRDNPRWRMLEIAINNFINMHKTKEYDMKVQFVTNITNTIQTYDITLESVTCIEVTKLPVNYDTPIFTTIVVQRITNSIILVLPICCWCFRENVISALKQIMKKIPIQLFRTRHECSLLSCSCCRTCRMIFKSYALRIEPGRNRITFVDDTAKQNNTSKQQDCDADKQSDNELTMQLGYDDDNTRHEPELVSAQNTTTSSILKDLLDKRDQIPIFRTTNKMTLIEKALCYTPNQDDKSSNSDNDNTSNNQLQPGPLLARNMNIIIYTDVKGRERDTRDGYYVEILEIDENGILRAYIKKDFISKSVSEASLLKSLKNVIDIYRPKHLFRIDKVKRAMMLKELKHMNVAPSIIKFIRTDTMKTMIENTNENKMTICKTENLLVSEISEMQNLKVQNDPFLINLNASREESSEKEIPKRNESTATLPSTAPIDFEGKIYKIPTTSYYTPTALEKDPTLHEESKQNVYVLSKNKHRGVILVPAQTTTESTPTTHRPAVPKNQKTLIVPSPVPFTVKIPALRKTIETETTVPMIGTENTNMQHNLVKNASELPFANKGLAKPNPIDDAIVHFIKSNKDSGFVLQSLIDHEVSRLSKSKLQGLLDKNVWNQIHIESASDTIKSNDTPPEINAIIKDIFNKYKDIELSMNSAEKVTLILNKSSVTDATNFELWILSKIIKHAQSLLDRPNSKPSFESMLPVANLQNQELLSKAPIKETCRNTNEEHNMYTLENTPKVPIANVQFSGSVIDNSLAMNMDKQKRQTKYKPDSVPVTCDGIIELSSDDEETGNMATLVEVIPKSEDTCVAVWYNVPNKSHMEITESPIIIGNKDLSLNQPNTSFGGVSVPNVVKNEVVDSDMGMGSSHIIFQASVIKEETNSLTNSPNSAVNKYLGTFFQEQPSMSRGIVPTPFILKRDNDDHQNVTFSSQINFAAPIMINESGGYITYSPNTEVLHQGYQSQPSKSNCEVPVPFAIKHEGADDHHINDSSQVRFPLPFMIKSDVNMTEFPNTVFQSSIGYQYHCQQSTSHGVVKPDDQQNTTSIGSSSHINFLAPILIKNDFDDITEIPKSVIYNPMKGYQCVSLNSDSVDPVPFEVKHEDGDAENVTSSSSKSAHINLPVTQNDDSTPTNESVTKKYKVGKLRKLVNELF